MSWSIAGSRDTENAMAEQTVEQTLASIGANVRRRRKRIGITQEHLAELAELTPRHLQRIERGTVNLSVGALVRLAHVLELAPAALLRPAKVPPGRPGRGRAR